MDTIGSFLFVCFSFPFSSCFMVNDYVVVCISSFFFHLAFQLWQLWDELPFDWLPLDLGNHLYHGAEFSKCVERWLLQPTPRSILQHCVSLQIFCGTKRGQKNWVRNVSQGSDSSWGSLSASFIYPIQLQICRHRNLCFIIYF